MYGVRYVRYWYVAVTPSVGTSVGGDVARTRYPWLVETLDTPFYGPPRRVNTNAD